MRETPRARAAFNDYLAMGPDRSLPKLAARYRTSIDSVPTRHLSRLLVWSQQHSWQQRLADITEAERQAIVSQGIADKVERVRAQNDRWHRMRQVIAERAEAPETQDVAGGKTGLIVHNVKGVGKGEDFQLIDLYEVDTGLLKELREHEKQAAQELGQWSEKHELTGKDGGAIEVKVDDARERLIARLTALAERSETGQPDRQLEQSGSGEAAV